MKKFFKNKFLLFIFVSVFSVIVSGCAANEGEISDEDLAKCTPIKEVLDPNNNVKYKPITIPDGAGVRKGIITWVVDKVTEVVEDASEKMYEAISEDDEYRAIVGICITLSVMFYAGAIMLGMSQLNAYSGLLFAMKVVLIYNFAVNWDDFQFYILDTLEAFIRDGVNMAANTFSDYESFDNSDPNLTVLGKVTVIGEMDKMISILWDFRMFKIVMALMLTGITGFFWGLSLFGFIIFYLLAVLEVIKIYLLALIGRYVLYALGPIFLTFLLFNQTRSLFDGWMKTLISFTLQPVFLFLFVGMFNAVIAGFMNTIFLPELTDPDKIGQVNNGAGVTLEKETCIKYELFENTPFGKMYWWRLCNGADCKEGGIKPQIPIDIWVLLSCLIVCYMMFSMTTWIVEVANTLASGAMALGGVQLQGVPQIKQAIGGAVQSGVKGIMSSAGKAGRGVGGG